jgi:hypothetical protein
MGGHEVDGFGRNAFGKGDQISFVFAVFVVNDDNHLAGAQVVEGFVN